MKPPIWEDGELTVSPHELVPGLYVISDGERQLDLHWSDVQEIARAVSGAEFDRI